LQEDERRLETAGASGLVPGDDQSREPRLDGLPYFLSCRHFRDCDPTMVLDRLDKLSQTFVIAATENDNDGRQSLDLLRKPRLA
jgi:hypothetical protein